MRAVALLALLLLAACKTELYSGLTEREANAIVAALGSEGIPAAKLREGETLTVSVDDARFSDAMAVLDARGLPAEEYASMGEVFQREGLVSSPTEERARMVYALSQELSRTISQIDNVVSARIHVVLPESDVLGRDVKPSSASVFIRHIEGAQVQDFTPQIKLLVANSIEGLTYDNISVVMVPAAATEARAPAMEFENVLGIWVHPAAAPRLWMMLGGLSAVALAGVGLAAAPHLRRLTRAKARQNEA